MYKILTFGPEKFFIAHVDPKFFFFFEIHTSVIWFDKMVFFACKFLKGLRMGLVVNYCWSI